MLQVGKCCICCGPGRAKQDWKPSKALGSAGGGLLAVGSEGRGAVCVWRAAS